MDGTIIAVNETTAQKLAPVFDWSAHAQGLTMSRAGGKD